MKNGLHIKEKIKGAATLRGYGHLLFYRTKIFWAEWLELKTKKTPIRQLYLLLILFSTAWGSYFCILIINGVSGTTRQIIPVTNITSVTPPGLQQAPLSINPEEYYRIMAFRAHLDSLHSYDIEQYDKTLSLRPGLLDSLRKIELYYESKNIKNDGKK